MGILIPISISIAGGLDSFAMLLPAHPPRETGRQPSDMSAFFRLTSARGEEPTAICHAVTCKGMFPAENHRQVGIIQQRDLEASESLRVPA